MKNILKITGGTKKVLVSVIAISILIVVSAYIYYQNINQSVDPRVLSGRMDLVRFNELLKQAKFDEAFSVIKRVERIYSSIPGYQDTFELGVVYNNMASVYILRVETEYLKQEKKGQKIGTPDELKLYLRQARLHLENAIDRYQKWLALAQNMDKSQLLKFVTPNFTKENPAFEGFDLEAIINQRVDDLILSKEETKRRLSVSYTNLGVINRYMGKPEEAESNYKVAMALWSENHVAKNNLNMLYGKPREERSIIQKLFPPDRKKKSP